MVKWVASARGLSSENLLSGTIKLRKVILLTCRNRRYREISEHSETD